MSGSVLPRRKIGHSSARSLGGGRRVASRPVGSCRRGMVLGKASIRTSADCEPQIAISARARHAPCARLNRSRIARLVRTAMARSSRRPGTLRPINRLAGFASRLIACCLGRNERQFAATRWTKRCSIARPPARIYIRMVKGAGHEDLEQNDRTLYRAHVLGFPRAAAVTQTDRARRLSCASSRGAIPPAQERPNARIRLSVAGAGGAWGGRRQGD